MSINSRFKAFKIIGQWKAYYRQRIPGSSCARKGTVDIDILVTSRNGDRKILQYIWITSKPTSSKRKWNQLSQSSTKINTYRKDLGWPHFNDEPKVQEKLQKYCKDLLFWVLWVCLIMATENDGICFKETFILIFMLKIKFILTSFFPRFCKFVTLGTLRMPGHPHQNNSIFL